MTNPNKGKWYRFNDTVVEEFEMTEESLENECFGGKYKAKFSDSCKFAQLAGKKKQHSDKVLLMHFFVSCYVFVSIIM